MVNQERLLWLNNKQTQEVINHFKFLQVGLRENIEGAAYYDGAFIKRDALESLILDKVINFLRTGNYLSTPELRDKVKKEQQG